MVSITGQPPAFERGFGRTSSIRWISCLLFAALPLYLFWTVRTIGGALDFDGRTVVLLSAAVASEFGAKWAFGELFRDGAPAGAAIARSSAFRAALVGTGVARLIPAGGAITPVAMAWSVGARSESATGAAFRATVLNYGGLVLGAGIGLLVTSMWHDVALHGVATAVGAGASALGVTIVAASSRIGALTRVIPRRWRARLESTFVDHPLGMRSVALLAARVLLEAATLGFTLRAFGVVLPASSVIATFGLAQVVGGLPGPPGGLGFTEVGLAAMLGYVGVPGAVAASPVLVFRVVSYWLPAVGGVLAIASTVLRGANRGVVDAAGTRPAMVRTSATGGVEAEETALEDTGAPLRRDAAPRRTRGSRRGSADSQKMRLPPGTSTTSRYRVSSTGAVGRAELLFSFVPEPLLLGSSRRYRRS